MGFNGEPTPIPESQIQDIGRVLSQPERLETEPYITEGAWIEIIRGSLAGMRGKLLQRRGRHRLVVGIDLIQQAVSVVVEMSSVRCLKDPV